MKQKLISGGKRTLFLAIRVLGLFYFVIVIAVLFFMDRFLFLGETLPADFKFEFETPFSEKWIDVNGKKIHSLYFSAPRARGLILYFHGNAGSLRQWGEVAEELVRDLECDVWIVDYPGYGKSEGKIKSEDQLFQIAEAMWKEAVGKYPPEKIMIYGRSLGSGIAVELASKTSGSLLVLESPYYSLIAMVKSIVPLVPAMAIPYPMRSDERIVKVSPERIFIFHGTDDEVIPFSQGERLAALVPGARFFKIQGGRHNDLVQFHVIMTELQKHLGIVPNK